MFRRTSGLVIIMAALVLGAVWADVTVPTMFSDHAVLQREMEVPVWGTASPGEQVTVDFAGQSKMTTANASGSWSVTLDAMSASTSPSNMVITGNNVITITDVQVGEVWLGGGQSNMANSLIDDCDATAAIADAGNYNMRFFNVTGNGGSVPDTVWEVSDASSAPSFSAVHFYFGRHLAQEMPDVPIGLIGSALGATAIERWADCTGGSGDLYVERIIPLQPYAIKGATWYQGEWDSRNVSDSEKYYWQMPCLIDEWRADWGQGNFPFYIVQMPKMTLSTIHIVRDAELQTALDDPMAEMIVTIDQPGWDVHPPCKDPFGIRLAMLARKFEYGHGIYARSPFYNADASYISGDTIGVVFDNVADGLESSGGALAEWEIADSGGVYVAADAVIVGTDTVEVSNPSVSNPVSARYAYRPNPVDNNLINSAGLPASPIREVAPSSSPVCGDETCDAGEDQCNCPDDCGTPPTTETSCDDGIDEDCDTYFDCDDIDCDGDPACSYCGDGTCDPDEDSCNCSADCGLPPETETTCDDGIDEDCDTYTDCDDIDCDGDPACPSSECGNDICEEGEDCQSCPDDCDGRQTGPPNGRFCCGNGEAESAEGDGSICDGNY
jgi:sialate O-acetylesterase